MKRIAVCVAFALGIVASVGHADLLEDGAKLFGAGKYAEAVEMLRKAVDETPGNAKAHLFLASAHEKLEQWADAADSWEKFIKFAKTQGERDYALARLKECRQRAEGKGTIAEPDKKEESGFVGEYTRHDGPFQMIKSDHFLVQCRNPQLGRQASKEAERHLKRITATFIEGREWPHVITIRIHRDHPSYVKEAGTPQWSGGGYMFRNYGPGNTVRQIELYALDKDGKYIEDLLIKTLPHELTHLVLHEYFGERTFSTLPRALNEGLAMYTEEGTSVLYEKQLADAVKRGVYFKLNDLYKMRQYPANVGLFYAQSASATRYLIEHMTAEQFNRFLGEIRKGSELNSALQSALGRTGDLLIAMEANWVEMLKGKADEYAKADAEAKTKPKPEKKPPAKEPVKPASETPETPPKEAEPKETPDDENVIIEVE